MPMGQMQKTIKLNVGTSEDLWPYQVVDVIEQVMEEGLVKHPEGDGWEQTADFHIKRAVKHLAKKTDEDLAHAFTRLMMAMAIKGGYGQTEFDAMVAERDKKKGGR